MRLVRVKRKIDEQLQRMLEPWQPYWLRFMGVEGGEDCHLYGLPIINKAPGSTIRVGRGFTARSKVSSNSIGLIQPTVLTTSLAGAQLLIDDDVGISGGAVTCRELVTLKSRVWLGSGVLLMDNDSHSLDPTERLKDIPNIRTAPVIIEEDVFVGARSIILKGTTIGPRSIVQAGSVVAGTFPADCIIGGNPARILSTKTDTV